MERFGCNYNSQDMSAIYFDRLIHVSTESYRFFGLREWEFQFPLRLDKASLYSVSLLGTLLRLIFPSFVEAFVRMKL